MIPAYAPIVGVDQSSAVLSSANAAMRRGDYQSALNAYEILRVQGHSQAAHIELNIQLCCNRLAQSQVVVSNHLHRASIAPNFMVRAGVSVLGVAAGSGAIRLQDKVSVSLTTIDSRLPHLNRVIESLHQQEVQPKEIRLYISREPYLLDKGISPDDPHLKELQKFPLLRVKWVDNTGPYRKIVPFLQEHFSHHVATDELFVTVDDDTLYPSEFLRVLLETYQKHDCVVAFRGRAMALEAAEIASYPSWGIGLDYPSMSNLPTGKDGVLYSTRFFTRDFVRLDDAIALAPTADDLWIKWQCGLNGVPAIVLNPIACTSDYKGFPVVDYSKEYRGNSLYSSYNANSAQGKNDDSVRKLEAYFKGLLGQSLAEVIQMAQPA
jgi:hypothetical protein